MAASVGRQLVEHVTRGQDVLDKRARAPDLLMGKAEWQMGADAGHVG
jgi:hypothetical protein